MSKTTNLAALLLAGAALAACGGGDADCTEIEADLQRQAEHDKRIPGKPGAVESLQVGVGNECLRLARSDA